MRLFALSLLLSTAAATACGIETGNGLATVKTGLVSGDNTSNGFTGTDAQGTVLMVDSARAYLKHFTFYPESGASTTIDGPFAADLITRTTIPSVGNLDLPAQVYKRVDIRLTKEKNSDGIVAMNDKLSGQTLIASGTINYPMGSTTPFELSLRFEDDSRFEDEVGVVIGDDGLIEDVYLDFDVQTWFATLPITECLDEGDLMIEDGRITIRDRGNRCNAIELSLKESIRASSKLRKKK